ncbi:unnamed protein product [Agarophyton chilense]
MLSDNQKEVIRNRVNAQTDIPFLRESTESALIDTVIDTLNPHIEPSLRQICPAPYVDCIKIALTESIPIEQRREQISIILQQQLVLPLASQLNGKLDVSLIPESVEQKLLTVLSSKIIDEFVQWTVAEIDERMQTSLVQSRDAAAL